MITTKKTEFSSTYDTEGIPWQFVIYPLKVHNSVFSVYSQSWIITRIRFWIFSSPPNPKKPCTF